MKRVMVLLVLAGIVTGCSEEGPTSTNPSTPIVWALPAQTEATPADCPGVALTPVRVDWDATHRSLSMGGEKMLWPAGFSARILTTGHLEILAPDGTVVAGDGQTIALDGTDYQHVCRIQGRSY